MKIERPWVWNKCTDLGLDTQKSPLCHISCLFSFAGVVMADISPMREKTQHLLFVQMFKLVHIKSSGTRFCSGSGNYDSCLSGTNADSR